MAEVKQWITVHPNGADSKGQPIPVMEGESKGQAVKNFVNKHKKDTKSHKNEVKELNKKSTEEIREEVMRNPKKRSPLPLKDFSPEEKLQMTRDYTTSKYGGDLGDDHYNKYSTDVWAGTFDVHVGHEGEFRDYVEKRTLDKVANTLKSKLSDSEKKTLLVTNDLTDSDMRTVAWKTDKVYGDNVDKMWRGKPIYKQAIQMYNPQTRSWKTIEEGNIGEDIYNDYLSD